MPLALFTFLECYETKGKHIYPLCTHEGSGLGQSLKDIQKLCPQAIIHNGLAIRGSQVKQAKNEINEWLKEIGGKE